MEIKTTFDIGDTVYYLKNSDKKKILLEKLDYPL